MQTAAQASDNRCSWSRRNRKQVDGAFAMMADHNVAAIVYAASPFFQVVSERLSRSRRVTGFPHYTNGVNS